MTLSVTVSSCSN